MNSNPPYIASQKLWQWKHSLSEFFERGLETDTERISLESRKRWGNNDEPTRDDTLWESVTQRQIIRTLRSKPADDALPPRWLVVVDSGEGKTTLLKRFAQRVGGRRMLALRFDVDKLPFHESRLISHKEIMDQLVQIVLAGKPQLKKATR